MEFIAEEKSWWIILDNSNIAGVIDKGNKLEYKGEIMIFSDEKLWSDSCKKYKIEGSNILLREEFKINPVKNISRSNPNKI